MKLDKDSHKEVIGAWTAGVLIATAFVIFVSSTIISLIVIVLVVIFNCFHTAFFRVPKRHRVGSGTTVSSVADGEIVIVEKAFEDEFLKKECMKVSVYMDFFDVHVNFWPLDGVITYHKYHPGKFKLAYTHKSSEENEHYSSVIKNDNGVEILFKQISGTFARRIVCYSENGLETRAGEQCGVIKFGSRIDMFLPVDADIKVKIGDKVRGSETVIAEIS